MEKQPLFEKPKAKKPFSVFGVDPVGWLLILTFLLCFGLVAFIWVRNIGPVKVETITAEISDLWVEEIQSDEGGHRIYRIRLKQEDKEFTCSISVTMANQLYQYESDKSYEFLVNKTPGRCLVTEAIIID